MKSTFFTFLLAAVLIFSGCNKSAEFESIFNGKDLSGWEVKCVYEDINTNYWYVEDSILVANSMGDSIHNYIWLQYNELVSDFHLKLKFQSDPANKGNTGIQIWSLYDEEDRWLNGPQVDVHPLEPWRTGMMWDETRGYQRWIFPDLPKGEWVTKEMTMNKVPFYGPDDDVEWNEIEVIGDGGTVKTILNGIQVTDFQDSELLADSIHKAVGIGHEGYILLQIHIKDQLYVRFKDIELKKLN